MTNWRKHFFYFLIVGISVIVTGCGSKRLETKSSQKLVWQTGYIKNKLGITISTSNESDRKALKLYLEASHWIGTPYRYGGFSVHGIDCSGLTKIIYKRVYNLDLPRTTAGLNKLKTGHRISKRGLKTGDLILFKTNKGNKHQRVNHVGIYLKDGYFIHASNHGVKTDHLKEPYYKKTWKYNYRINKETRSYK